jgi:thiol-disulfide isomerase/thioredoxin
LTGRVATPGVSRDFSQIPIFPPDRATRGRPAIQPKLIVGQANDPLEYEADSVAAQVMRMSAPAPLTVAAVPGLRRKCNACEEEEKKQRLQAKPIGAAETAAAEAPPIVREVLRSPGRPLDPPTRAFFEGRFRYDFSSVRIHADDRASDSAGLLGAQAYTVGSRIVFGSGRYAPETSSGRHLLAHELTHVVQNQGHLPGPVGARSPSPQGAGTIRRQPSPKPSATDTNNFDDVKIEAVPSCFQPFSGPSLDPILKSGTITVIEFSADWCGPCKTLVRILNEQCQDYKKSQVPIRYYSVDVELPENEKLANRYDAGTKGSWSLPQFFVFLGKEQKHHSDGFKGPDFYRDLLSRIIKEASSATAAPSGKSGLSRLATTGIFAAAGALLAGGILGIAALAGASVGLAPALGILGAGLLVGGLLGFLDPFGLTERTRPAGAQEADQLIRQRFGQYLPRGGGPLHDAKIRPVSRSELLMRWRCRHPNDTPNPNMIGWTDQGDPEVSGKDAAGKPAADPMCADGKPLEHASFEHPVIYYATDHPDATVLIHEGIHSYAHPDFAVQVRGFLNEGAAEYFSQQVAADIRAKSKSGYGDQVNAVADLVTVIGEEALRRAYFRGDFSAADAKLGPCGLVTWALDKQQGQDRAAEAILKGPKRDHCREP